MVRGRPATAPGTYGNIFMRQLPNGRWQADLRVRLASGQLKRIRAEGTSKAEATRKIKARVRDAVDTQDTAELKTNSPITQLVTEWLRQHQGSANSKEVYRSALTNHIAPAIGQLRINEATTARLDQFIQSIRGPSTAKRVRSILSGAFALAARYGLVEYNPVASTRSVKSPRPEPRALTRAEIVTVRRMVSYYTTAPMSGRTARAEPLPHLVDFLLGTGVRISEALTVRFSEVNLEATPPTATVHVTKDGGSERVIQLPDIAVRAVRAQLPWRAVSEYVFPTASGKPLSKSNVERWFRRAREVWAERPADAVAEEDVDVSWVTPHSFRTTVATLVAEWTDSDTAQLQLGHHSRAITERYYLQRPAAGPPVAEAFNTAFRDL